MIEATLAPGRPVRPELVGQLHELTDGNPFFVEEVLCSLVAGGALGSAEGGGTRRALADLRVPRSVQEAVELHSRRLSSAARETLWAAAVIGQRCDPALLRSLTGADDRGLDERLRELTDAGLPVETGSDQFGFRHALTREAVLGMLLARQRQPLHRQVVEALERRYPGPDAARAGQLAHHTYAAGDWPRTVRYGHVAGERAAGLFAPRAATPGR